MRILPQVDVTYSVHFGSLSCLVRSKKYRYAQMIAEVFGTELAQPCSSGTFSAELEITIEEDTAAGHCETSDRLRVIQTGRNYTVQTDPLFCLAERAGQKWHLGFLVRQLEMTGEHLAYHFWIVLNTLLLLIFGRILLHAAAVKFHKAVFLFLGPKGVGKTTLAASLVTEGSTMLAEDHVHVRFDGKGWLVSGCSGRLRMTEETERFLFTSPLSAKTVCVGGVKKKEIEAKRFFPSEPHRDFPVHRLYFMSRGGSLRAHPLNLQDTLLELISNIRKMYRFSRKEDYARLLDLLADFASKVPSYSLRIPDDLNELSRVVAFVSETCRVD